MALHDLTNFEQALIYDIRHLGAPEREVLAATARALREQQELSERSTPLPVGVTPIRRAY
jgi:hypothetical protein